MKRTRKRNSAKRTETVTFRATPSERARLNAVASEFNMSLSDFLLGLMNTIEKQRKVTLTYRGVSTVYSFSDDFDFSYFKQLDIREDL